MKNILLYTLFQFVYLIIIVLPASFQSKVGKGLGAIIYKLVKSRNNVVRENLKMAFSDEYTECELEEITRKIYDHFGMMLVEFILLKKISINELNSSIEIDGEEYLKSALKKGHGVILYSAHFGNWEWLIAYLSSRGYPVNAIAQTQNNPYFDKKVNEIRTSKGLKIIPRGMSLRQAFRSLKNGELLCILGDQDARRNGWMMNFFGQPTSTYPGPVQMAARTGAVIVPVYLIRKDWHKYYLKVYKPYCLNKGDSEKKQSELLQDLTELTEEVIRKHPEQWLWLHRRWKTSPGEEGG